MHSVYPQISKIGLGCVTFGREIDKKASFAMMDHGFEQGIRFFDTAAAYGAGASERIVGEWLTANRAVAGSIVVATKILPPFTLENINASVALSLKHLKTDSIDLLYLHSWDPTAEAVASLKLMSDLVEDGKLRFLGASNFTAAQIRHALRLQMDHGFTRFGFVQNNQNLAVSDINEEFREVCSAHDIRIVTYSPLGAGFLTGKHQQRVQPGSRFALVPGHQDIYFQETAIRRFARLQQFAALEGRTTTELALIWALHQPGVTSVLVSGRVPGHIDQAFAALRADAPELLDKMELIEKYLAGQEKKT